MVVAKLRHPSMLIRRDLWKFSKEWDDVELRGLVRAVGVLGGRCAAEPLQSLVDALRHRCSIL
jgi:predicted transcriptional regulator